MKKSINKLVLKTDKIVSLSVKQTQQIAGGAANWGSYSCGQTCSCKC